MIPFTLIHGSGQNARCWDRVRAILEAAGHAVSAPELPKQAPTWSLGDYAGYIAEHLAGPGSVVVAHSFSGVFLPLVAERRPCALLVFLAAVIPEPGVSVREQFSRDSRMFSEAWIAAGPRWFDPAQREDLAREFLFHDCDAATLGWALSTADLFDTRHLVTEPSPFSGWPAVPTASIVATGDRTLTPDWGIRTGRAVLGIESLEIEAGHCPHVSRPDQVAALLRDLAQAADRGRVAGASEAKP